ncbi:hypothetical protein B296_00053878 [Ensete ventricosum]|uniref:Uncharacterized protein n=1 Tax=Ensete ventricosum TaxID=4639 RepID=A0A426WX23_ENSVE|nr:hypothetical protein B296_00053878 [Ensete ventricosum]
MMLPLRFSISGIRAKAVHAKIGFKLSMMRLNCVEPFYVFVVAIDNDGSGACGLRGNRLHVVCLQGWSTMARPPTRVADCGQAPLEVVGYCQGPLEGHEAATGYGFDTRKNAAYGQRHRLQGLPLAGAAGSRGNARRGDARGGATYKHGACPQGTTVTQ